MRMVWPKRSRSPGWRTPGAFIGVAVRVESVLLGGPTDATYLSGAARARARLAEHRGKRGGDHARHGPDASRPAPAAGTRAGTQTQGATGARRCHSIQAILNRLAHLASCLARAGGAT
jgi:hypothetical protein